MRHLRHPVHTTDAISPQISKISFLYLLEMFGATVGTGLLYTKFFLLFIFLDVKNIHILC